MAARATPPRVRKGAQVIKIAVMVATGVKVDGFREILGVATSTAESGAGWNSFFKDLVARGLPGVALVTSDATPRKRHRPAWARPATCTGLSTRRIDRLVQSLGITGLSKSQVSVIQATSTSLSRTSGERPLDAGRYKFVAADALTMKGWFTKSVTAGLPAS